MFTGRWDLLRLVFPITASFILKKETRIDTNLYLCRTGAILN
jgi:hypothetical protein